MGKFAAFITQSRGIICVAAIPFGTTAVMHETPIHLVAHGALGIIPWHIACVHWKFQSVCTKYLIIAGDEGTNICWQNIIMLIPLPILNTRGRHRELSNYRRLSAERDFDRFSNFYWSRRKRTGTSGAHPENPGPGGGVLFVEDIFITSPRYERKFLRTRLRPHLPLSLYDTDMKLLTIQFVSGFNTCNVNEREHIDT